MPRHLISSESSYFREQFARQLQAQLRDVQPWVFRVFVRWLHKGDVYYDSERLEPTRFSHSGQEDCSKLDSSDEEWVTVSEGDEVKERGGADYWNPVTWPHSWLFEIYLFAVAYQVRLFRLDVQDIIHMKLLETRLMPEPAEIAMVVDKLTLEDNLYQLLAHWVSSVNTGKFGRAKLAQAEHLSVVPSTFAWLSLALRDSKYAARNCSICSGSNTIERCNATDHSRTDAMSPRSRIPCFYHEHHGNMEEESRCWWRWWSRAYRIRTIDLCKKAEIL